MKHTEGPWRIEVSRDGSRFIVGGKPERRIAKLSGGTALSAFPDRDPPDVQTMRANANLLAASPDLYSVVAALVEGEDRQDLLDKAVAALAAADGR